MATENGFFTNQTQFQNDPNVSQRDNLKGFYGTAVRPAYIEDLVAKAEEAASNSKTYSDKAKQYRDEAEVIRDETQVINDQTDQVYNDTVQVYNDTVSQATDAANSATAAAQSESNAASSETNAANSAVIASGFAADAESAFDNFNDQYLGAKPVDPTTDNDGNPLQVGATYWNSTTHDLRFWNGATWDIPEQTATQAANTAVAASDSAQVSETNAAASETSAAQSESNAAQSAADALASENAAAGSETNAANSASSASTSATNAASSATAAATSEANAATSESNAATSEANAATSESNAAVSASAASTSETNASNSESAAATSEANALASENAAATSASNAATSEANAATSASNAATSEANAAQSATDAQQSADDAAAIVPSLQSQIDTLDGEVVKTSGDQIISGVKTFNQDIITTSIRSALGSDQGLLFSSDGSTRLGGLSDNSKGLLVSTRGTIVHSHSGGSAFKFRDEVNSGTGSSSYMEWEHNDGVRRGYLGYGTASNNHMAWTNNHGNNSIILRDDGRITLDPGTDDVVDMENSTLYYGRSYCNSAEGGSWGHSSFAATALLNTNSGQAYNVFKVGTDGPKMMALGEGGNTVRLYPGGGNENFAAWLPSAWTHHYTGTGSMTWEMYARTPNVDTSIRMREDGGAHGTEFGYAASSSDNEFFLNMRYSGSDYRALSIYRDRTLATFNTEELRIDSSGATKLGLHRAGNDANVNIRFNSDAGDEVYFGKTYYNLAIGGVANLSDPKNQWVLFSSSFSIFRNPVYLPGSNPTSNNMAARKAYVDSVSSDRNLKTGVTPVEDALNIVNSLPVYTYEKDILERNDVTEEDEVVKQFEYGFIAQEVETVLPHLIIEGEDGMKNISRKGNDFHAIAFKAIQELSEENKQLKDRLAAIEAHLGLGE